MELAIKLVLTAWEGQNKSFDKLLSFLNDDQLSKETSPGKNTGWYLLGHLVAVSDAMLPLLGFGERLYPELEPIFLSNPDKSGLVKTSITELKDQLVAVNAKLNSAIAATPAEGWMQKHSAVTAEAFEKEPHRNKLNIIITRTNHMAYHLGQMMYLK